MAVLGDLRVVELATGVAGGYAGKLFTDAGADVVKVEPPGGDPLRRWTASGADPGGGDGALFAFLNASKRSIVGTLGDAHVGDVISGADVVIESFEPGVVEAAGLLDEAGLVVLSLTPWGRGGPLSGRPATEFIVQAECGSLAGRGRHDGPPVQAGGRIGEWAAGTYGAPAALAAVRQARSTGRAVHIDVSMVEAMCQCTNLYADLMHSLAGRPPLQGPGRLIEMPSIEPTADGWVGFNTNATQMFQDFLVLIGRAELIDDPAFASYPGRLARVDEWNAMVHAYTGSHTTAEVIEAASLLRIPVVPVCDGRNVLDQEQFVSRDVFGPEPGGRFRGPRPPYRIDGVRPQAAAVTPAPSAGQHQDAIEPRARLAAAVAAARVGVAPAAPAGVTPDSGSELPFAGLRVLDTTCWWAGPAATQFLAALGADVIHVEAIQRVDGMRLAAALAFVDREQWWEYSSFFLAINPNKRDLTLDLSTPDGLHLARRLVEWADVVVENYTPRVMDAFGLDWAGVHRLNPRAVMVRMPAFGLDGPWRDRPGFAQNMEQMAGLAWITGFPDDVPMIPRGPCDPLGGMHAAFALQVALTERDRTGRGMLVEAPLIESALNIAAEQVVEYTAYGQVLARDGNRSPGAAPQGAYPCLGGEWLALSVETDEQWEGLVGAVGWGGWAHDRSLAGHAGRAAAQDRLDHELSQWAAGGEAAALAARLTAAGVPAAVLADPRVVSRHPHFVAREFFEHLDHPVVGTHPVMSLPFRWTGIDRWYRSPAPTLGEHNHEILHDVLGLPDEEIGRLAAERIIGDRPAGL